MTAPAIAWLLFLAPLFFLTYGFANWVTSLRDHVPVIVFAWERRIPFLAWTIIPYWSTDLFYAASLFLCRTRHELNTLGKRLFAVQLLCVATYLLLPLRFSFERPHADGLFGRMFDALMSFDKPFNQAPSLHAALTAVLWVAYGRHFRGWRLFLIRAWFLLTVLSTLTTWQHHFIDLPTGLWVGLFSLALFRENQPRTRFEPSKDPRRFALAVAYFTGAAICAIPVFLFGGLAWILLWPSAALALVAGIYVSGRPELFRKSAGAMPPAVIAILFPYLAGAWLNSRWHTRQEALAHEIAGGVWLGRIPRRSDLTASGFASVVDLTAELSFTADGVTYRGVPMLDLLTPSPAQLEVASNAIRDLEPHRPTLVFCALGYSRSALSVAAWLIDSRRVASSGEAVDFIRARRPSVVISESSLR